MGHELEKLVYGDGANDSPKKFQAGCIITNIRQGTGHRATNIYANLRGPSGDLLISATLEYINKRLIEYGIEDA